MCARALSIITSISFDHQQQLGNTLAKIAAEKAGIIKDDVPVIHGVRAMKLAMSSGEWRKAIVRIYGNSASTSTPKSHPLHHLEKANSNSCDSRTESLRLRPQPISLACSGDTKQTTLPW